MALLKLLLVGSLAHVTTARWLFSNSPASPSSIITQGYVLGNGRLGAMPAGTPGAESINLNIDSLWTEGPFSNSSYNGGNPKTALYDSLPGIREFIFQNGTGNVSALLGQGSSYGSYTALGNLTVTIDGLDDYDSYFRGLDLETATQITNWTVNSTVFESKIFCSFPDNVCVYSISSSDILPSITFGLETQYLNSTLYEVNCNENHLVLNGSLSKPGMQFHTVARLLGSQQSACSEARLVVQPKSKSAAILVAAGTNYDQTRGNSENNFTFRGVEPASEVEQLTTAAANKSLADLHLAHVQDYASLFGAFSLDLSDPLNSSKMETATAMRNYVAFEGDPFIESLLFDFGRYLLISSSRNNSLPANLQGRWAPEQSPAWSADYHANINVQMNYWGAPQTGLGSLQDSLWKYMAQTWVPYGQRTAQLLYNASEGAWVVHNEMNIFGFTGMKGQPDGSVWANYPAAAAWMMEHVYDWFDYSGDVEWYRTTGYPLMKGVAIFWLSQLQEDRYFNDDTLVVNPCNSPEHGPTTFGCTHYQQYIWQLYDRILATWEDTGDSDTAFLDKINATFHRLDSGLHIGSWGQIQEWKLDLDTKNDTHRHLSNLNGWFPGYSISGAHGTNITVQKAVETTLYSRGRGNAADANAGWAKVWRSACWARLNNTERAFFELSYAIDENIAGNGLSMYDGLQPPFQIDANFGLVGAVLAMLVTDLPQGYGARGMQTVVLGPAIPPSWKGGSVIGLRLRGGGEVDFSWNDAGVVEHATIKNRKKPLQGFNVNNEVVALV